MDIKKQIRRLVAAVVAAAALGGGLIPALATQPAQADGIFCDPTYLNGGADCLGTWVSVRRVLVQSYGSALSGAYMYYATPIYYCGYAGCVADTGYWSAHGDYPGEHNHSGFGSSFHGYYYS